MHTRGGWFYREFCTGAVYYTQPNAAESRNPNAWKSVQRRDSVDVRLRRSCYHIALEMECESPQWAHKICTIYETGTHDSWGLRSRKHCTHNHSVMHAVLSRTPSLLAETFEKCVSALYVHLSFSGGSLFVARTGTCTIACDKHCEPSVALVVLACWRIFCMSVLISEQLY